MSTPHSASRLGENASFGVRFLCLRHSYVNCSVCISTPVDSPSVRAAFLWIFLSTSHLLGFSVRSQFLGENVFLLTPAGLALLLARVWTFTAIDEDLKPCVVFHCHHWFLFCSFLESMGTGWLLLDDS